MSLDAPHTLDYRSAGTRTAAVSGRTDAFAALFFTLLCLSLTSAGFLVLTGRLPTPNNAPRVHQLAVLLSVAIPIALGTTIVLLAVHRRTPRTLSLLLFLSLAALITVIAMAIRQLSSGAF